MKIVKGGKVIADNVRHYKGIVKRSRGLRFSRKLGKKEAILLETKKESRNKTAIDMLFVFSAIDAVWLNKNMKIVDIKRDIRPFTPIVVPKKPAKYVIELARNASKDLKVGEKIEIKL